MTFLAPFYLLVGAAAVVPLLLHLLRRNISSRVDFPAARYLARAEQEHSRSLRLRNLLLMLLRVLLILALAFAAARPFVAGLGVGHGPTALAIVLDNSLSTTAVTGGTPTFARLRDATRALLSAATPGDRLWLVTADGRVRGGSRESLLAELARVVPIEDAGDLPLAFRRAAAAVQGSMLAAQVVAVATDGQQSAWSSASRAGVPVSLFVPGDAPPRNRAVLSVDAEPSRWTPRGTLVARIEAPDSTNYRVVLGTRTLARGAVARGEPIQLHIAPPERGWQALRVEIDPDDFVADDARYAAVWIGAPPAVSVDESAGPFIATAVSTLVSDGRAIAGHDVSVASADVVPALPALILPPPDPVRLGAANRALERLGVPWRFASVVTAAGTVQGTRLDGVTVSSRYRLVHDGAAASDTLATAAGEPWVVAGAGYVLVASRVEPAATNFPVRAAFVPWVADVLAQRLGAPAGDAGIPISVRPGARVALPPGTDAFESAGGARIAVNGEQATAPSERGVWFLLRAGRRIGAIVVNASAEESSLARTSATDLASRIADARGRASTNPGTWVHDSFARGNQRPATTPLLLLALLLIAAEAASLRSTRSNAA